MVAKNKHQLNTTVNLDVYELVRKVEEVTGMTSTRLVMASLVKFLFDGFCKVHQRGVGPQPDLSWVQWAMLLEREEIGVDDIPGAILENLVADAEQTLSFYQSEEKPDPAQVKDMKEKVKLAKSWLASWKADVAEFKGKTGAMYHFLERIVPRGPGIVNPYRT